VREVLRGASRARCFGAGRRSPTVPAVPDLADHPLPAGPDAAAPAGERRCQRPGCATTAGATLTFAYHSRETWIGPLAAELTPQAYDLCETHADRTAPPSGWALGDRRPTVAERAAAPGAPSGQDGHAGRTVGPRREEARRAAGPGREDAGRAVDPDHEDTARGRRADPGEDPARRPALATRRIGTPGGPAAGRAEALAAAADQPLEVRARAW
jgi:hypothetical protein